MSDKLPDSNQRNDFARRDMKSHFKNKLKNLTGKGVQPDGLRPVSRSRSSSRLSRRGKSPDPKNEKAENAQLTTGAHASAATPEVKSDDNEDAQPGMKTAATNSNKDDDMWTIAEKKLRNDPQKCEKLEEYDRILENQLGSKLRPIGTQERRKQVLDFLDSGIKRLEDTDSDTRLRKCSKKAKRFFKNAVGCIVATQGIISAAAAPCLPAAAACAGVTVLLSLCIQAADERHVLFEGLNIISSSIRRLTQYEDLLWNEGSQRVEEVEVSMTTACSNIIEFQARAACHLQLNPIESAIRNAFKWDGWEKLLSAIKEAEANVRECAERKGWRDIQKIFDRLDELKNESKHEISDQFSRQEMRQETIARKKKVDAFLQLLLDNGCLYTESKDRNRERVTGTCDWFTNHDLFKQWNLPTESQAPGLLYVTADPGCGKSVLSRYLIDQILPDDERTVCYFFFKDDFDQQKSSLRALCTLLHQLLISNRHLLTDDILDKYGAQGEKFVQSFFEMWSTLLVAAAHQETVCVLDALDECQDHDRNQLINAITSIYDHGLSKTTKASGLKFLLTSRPYEHIRREVSRRLRSQMASIHLQGDCGPTANEIVEEIKLVVESRIDETAHFFDLEPDERQLMKERLNSVPNRTYLWITLVFDGLMDKKPSITKRDIMDLTKKLPQGIYDAYEKILNKSLDREQSKRLLHLVLGAKRPLFLSEMSVALAFTGQRSCDDMANKIIPENRIQRVIRDLCGLFVIVVDKRIYLLHQTAREFLVRDDFDKKKARNRHSSNPKNYDAAAIIFITQTLTLLLTLLFSAVRSIFHRTWLFLTKSWKHSMDPTDSNSILAETCISYLQSDFAKENAAMFEYSAIYWVDHYCQSGEHCKAEVAEMTRNLCLLSERRTQWTKIYYENNMIPVTGSPLCLASALGLERAVKLFLREQDPNSVDLVNKVDIDSKDTTHGRTPLSWAAMGGHEAVVKLLLETGKVDVDSKDTTHGRTPLSWAAGGGHEAVVKLLLETGKVDVDSKDTTYGRTPLSWAAERGHEAVVKLLQLKH